ncbi:MAG: hypothetical protein IT449_01420 [Phycisphaerales bacterium]|nr:hypothetical protein [Phycisphaerales bacterium]
MRTGGWVLIFACIAGVARAQDPNEGKPAPPQTPTSPAPAPQTPPSEPAPAPPAPTPSRVEAILDALQKAGEELKDIRCRVVYDEDDQVNLSRKRREGVILFKKGEPNPRFFITFDRLVQDGKAAKEQKKVWYLFDGRNLLEARESTTTVIESEVAKPGDKVDFFDLDKTPFPLPFGHKKEYILERFDVSLVDAQPGDPPDSDHLVCTPKPNTRMASKFRKLEFHVGRAARLPIRIKAVSADGYKVTTADFPDLSEKSINPNLKDADFAEPGEWKKYKRTREKLEDSSAGRDEP